jgi:transcriptional regulator with XRE-family HTH domain
LSTFFDRLREERVRLGVTQDTLATAGGVQRRAQANYEAGERAPDVSYLAGVAKHGVDVLYVITGRREPKAQAPAHLPGPTAAEPPPKWGLAEHPVRPDTTHSGAPQEGGLASNVGGAVVVAADASVHRPLTLPVHFAAGYKREYQVIPRYKADASAGVPGSRQVGQDQLHADVAGVLAIEVEYMRRALGRDGAGFITVQVSGDSMEPTLAEGDLIIVDTARTNVDASGIYVVELQGDLLVKRVQRRMDGSLVLISDNAAYAPETIQAGAAHTLRVLGRMTRLRVR